MPKEEPRGKQATPRPGMQPQAVPPPPPPGSPGRKRPFLASILSIIIMIVGIFTILGGLIFIAAAGLLVGFLPSFAVPAAQFLALFGVLVMLLGILLFATGIGLWKLKKWALYLVGLPVVVYLGILGSSAALTGGFALALVCAPVPIIAIVLLLYLVSIRKRFL